jgi:protein-tyrosine phosphatase
LIDLHSHILPGLDDGARSLEDSRELARRAASDGVTAIAATPHVRDDYPTTAEQMERGVADLRRDFADQGIAVEILHGGELDLGRLPQLDEAEVGRFTFGQGGRYLLVEFPYAGWPLGFEQQLFELRLARLTPVIAHPERNREVKAAPERLSQAVEAGALVQLTAASLDGRLGRGTHATALQLLELRLAHLIASDAHTPDIREAGMANAAEAVGDAGLARYLTEDVPAAIVAGEEVDEPPAGPRRPARVKRFGLF